MSFITLQRESLGTIVRVTVPASYQSLAEEALQECQRIDEWYSRFRRDNVLFLLNEGVGEWQEVDEELWYLLSKAEEYRRMSEGAFNCTVKDVLEQWGYDSTYSLTPKAGKGTIGEIFLEETEQRVYLTAPVDTGGHGKGFAVDCMAAILQTVPDWYISAGGDVRVQGEAPEGGPWRILLEDPLDTARAIGDISLQAGALASSSANRRQWEGYHHLVDPEAGSPAKGMLATYVKADLGIDADAYATALYVMGFSKAKEMIPQLPVEALLISSEQELWMSEGFQANLYTTGGTKI